MPHVFAPQGRRAARPLVGRGSRWSPFGLVMVEVAVGGELESPPPSWAMVVVAAA
jgi:hypothetical protein